MVFHFSRTFNSQRNNKLGFLQRHKLGKRSYKSANGDFGGIPPKFSVAGEMERNEEVSTVSKQEPYGCWRLNSWAVWNKLVWEAAQAVRGQATQISQEISSPSHLYPASLPSARFKTTLFKLWNKIFIIVLKPNCVNPEIMAQPDLYQLDKISGRRLL